MKHARSMAFDISRPDIIFAAIWGLAFALINFLPTPQMVEFNSSVNWMILINIISFVVIYQIVKVMSGKGKGTGTVWQPTDELRLLRRFVKICFLAWFPLYLLNMVASGGMPILWLYDGSGRTYADYGIPTFSGLLNMVRAFMFATCVLLFLQTGRRRYAIYFFLLFVSSVLEVSRGGISFLLLHGVGMYMMHVKRTGRLLLFVVSFALLFVIGFGVLGELRGAHPPFDTLVGNQAIFTELPSGFFWAYTYITTPLNNLNFATSLGIEPLGYPYWSIQSLVPTIIRNAIFPIREYPIALVSAAFNATTFYSPLIADFGPLIACILVMLIQIIVSRYHVMAKRGSVQHILVYPVLFACVVMSIFFMFFFSMVTVLFPLIAFVYYKWRRGRTILK